jgi:hypothetical protein
MPHYKDGTEAQIGDYVIGHLANTPGDVAGTVISITRGSEACNAMVQFTVAKPFDGTATIPEAPRMVVRREGGSSVCRSMNSESHGASGPPYVLFTCADYADTDKLTKVG